MKISAKLSQKTPAFSFEFFPPKDEAGVDRLFETVARLKAYEPAYVSVTYGAGGSTRRLTVDLVQRIKREAGLEAMAHLTCVGATKGELKEVLDQLREGGIDNVLALRGDPQKGQASFVRAEGGFGYASELTSFIRQNYDFCLGGACYPERHPEAASAELDLTNLKRKVDSGTDFLVTQLFFDSRDYFSFVARARAAGIDVPIVAGIMPITNVSQIKRFTALCGACLPAPLLARLETASADPASVQAIGVEHATAQCRELLDGGAPGIHFYTLNRSPATVEVLDRLRR
ncbi:MAG TPA: methylenetetrahydrofolate reductase [NAD(P)H] [Polyangiaceae bacterium]|jgi:methylenetetrahydrofolate reductase (NADPH)|nr:methylenetetrahydrofolate reductase [NAD(P)H] [Polyangiaceae bacterium]